MFVIFKKPIFFRTIFILSFELDTHIKKPHVFIKRRRPQHIDFEYIKQKRNVNEKEYPLVSVIFKIIF